MLCLKQCIDLCELTPDEAATLAERASLAQVVAAQAACPRRGAQTEAAGVDREDVRCALLAQLHAANDFADLRRVAHSYRAFSLARAAAMG